MTDFKQNRIMAELNGWRRMIHGTARDYVHDLNAVDDVVKGLSPEHLANYEKRMVDMFGFTKALSASAAQRTECILRATDRWEGNS